MLNPQLCHPTLLHKASNKKSIQVQEGMNAYLFSTQYHVRLISWNVSMPQVLWRSHLNLSVRWSNIQPIWIHDHMMVLWPMLLLHSHFHHHNACWIQRSSYWPSSLKSLSSRGSWDQLRCMWDNCTSCDGDGHIHGVNHGSPRWPLSNIIVGLSRCRTMHESNRISMEWW